MLNQKSFVSNGRGNSKAIENIIDHEKNTFDIKTLLF